MRNLRRTRELALRNSAKCARNFGRSAAVGGFSNKVTGGDTKQSQATVYQKHRPPQISNEKYGG